ncbi:MAG: ORF6N domain-containing protein [Bacilli bacterium]|nr:ORF6N domain-containing protein [Bacilli bacterium]MBP3635477.1 ORF6N domain-containing protein [Bacilli bacterium]
MNEIMEKEIKVENLIYEIRGKQVMLDSDLARLYQCANGTKTINQAVKRNINRFPNRFMFQLTIDEYKGIFAVPDWDHNKMSRSLPHVFTEQGVAMLATVIRTKIAIEVSIKIMDAFVEMRRYISNSLIDQKYINGLVLKDNKRIDLLEDTFNSFKEKNNHIFFEGQIYDAYSLLLDILNKSKKEIIIIDNYAGKELLDILKNIDKNITIVSKNINKELIKKYNSQYSNINFINNNSFHDRFIIIDDEILYHSGSSFKDLGKKCFAINKLEDIDYLNKIINEIKRYQIN